MADSLHQVIIEASPATVYDAITQNQGIKGWWTDTCETTNHEGGHCTFWFDDRQTHFTMEATRLLPNQRVFWQCIGGPEEWLATELWWEITQGEGNTCVVDFKHMNWQRDDGLFPLCNSTWGSLMTQLKQFCETGVANPYFQNTAEPVS
ncbi:MAG: SRPBCC domain-containing protein [Bermanella sp.]